MKIVFFLATMAVSCEAQFKTRRALSLKTTTTRVPKGGGEKVAGPLVAMTWMAASVSLGSVGLMAPTFVPAPTNAAMAAARTLSASLVMWIAAFSTETAVFSLAMRAKPMLAQRLRTLSDSLQALTMATTCLACLAEAWRRYGAKVVPLSLAAAPGPLIMSMMYTLIRKRPSTAVHGWIPFIAVLSSLHAIFFDALQGAQKSRTYGSLMATWASVAGVLALSSLSALARSTQPTSLFALIPGLPAIAAISVIVDFAWVCSTLMFWSFHGISIRWGLGVVAVVSNVMEIAGARCADVSKDDDTIRARTCRRLGALTTSAFERTSFSAMVPASWRGWSGFWFLDDPTVRQDRLQRHFGSILMTYVAFGVTGAFRGHVVRCVFATILVTALILKVLYLSFYALNPLKFAGILGLGFGLTVLAAALFAPGLFDSAWGSETNSLLDEIASFIESLFSSSPTTSSPSSSSSS